MAIEKLFEKGNEAFIIYDCKTRNGRCSWNTKFFTIEENKIQDKRSRGLLWPYPKGTSVNTITEIFAVTKSSEVQTFALERITNCGAQEPF